jgi:glycosyltransferase involved in cell wall biosynthesis
MEINMAEPKPLVSIVIGNYNYDRFVGQAIESTLNQTYDNVEVIVVDDGSKDQSRKVISSYDNRIIPIFKENGGQPSTYNAGFAASQGEIICFLDSDDLFVPEKVEKVVQVFQSSDEIGWCFHSLQLIDKDNNPLSISTTENYKTRVCDFRSRTQSGKIPPSLPPSSGLCFRRSLLEKILPMPTPRSIKNNDYYIKFVAVGLSKGFILSDALTLQKIHGSNAETLSDGRQALRAKVYIYTALWIRERFPVLSKFANKLVTIGTAFSWIAGNKDNETKEALEKYEFSTTFIERLEIRIRAIYYYLKDQSRH